MCRDGSPQYFNFEPYLERIRGFKKTYLWKCIKLDPGL